MKNIEHKITLIKISENYLDMPGENFEMFNGELYKVEMDKELKKNSKEYFALLNGAGNIISRLQETFLPGNKITLNIKLE